MRYLFCLLLLLETVSFPLMGQGDFQRGVSYYKQGQHAKAAGEFEQLVASNPKYEDGWRILGDCYLKLRRYDEAIRAFQKALQLDSNKFVSNMGLALGYYNSGKYAEAIAALNRAERLARTPRDQYQVYQTRGSAFFNQSDFDRAVLDLTKAVTVQRGGYQDILQLGLAHFQLGNPTEAEKYLRQALTLNSNSQEAKRFLSRLGYSRAVQAIEGKNFAQASTILKEYLEANADDGAGWFNYGLARLFSDDPKGAEEAFQRSIRLDPKNWQAYDRLGYIYEKNKEYSKALQQYQRADSLSQDKQVKASVARVQERIRRQSQGSS